jgi:putrescine aminotransferase
VPGKAQALELTRRHVAPHRVDVWDAFGTQLVIERREGYRLWDLDGRELIDMNRACRRARLRLGSS